MMEFLQLHDSVTQTRRPSFEQRGSTALVDWEQRRSSAATVAMEPPKTPELRAKTAEVEVQPERMARSHLRYISSNQTIAIRAIASEYSKFLQEQPLTKREMEILQLIVNGENNCEIARHLHVSAGTVKTHVRNILNKLGVSDRTQAAVFALRSGLVD